MPTRSEMILFSAKNMYCTQVEQTNNSMDVLWEKCPDYTKMQFIIMAYTSFKSFTISIADKKLV